MLIRFNMGTTKAIQVFETNQVVFVWKPVYGSHTIPDCTQRDTFTLVLVIFGEMDNFRAVCNYFEYCLLSSRKPDYVTVKCRRIVDICFIFKIILILIHDLNGSRRLVNMNVSATIAFV